MDRRTARTRKWLRQALLTLIQEKPIELITIQEITDEADMARVTFYRHYKDKNELLIDCLDNLYGELIDVMHIPSQMASDEVGSVVYDNLKLWYSHIAANREVFKIIFNSSATALARRRMRELVIQQAVLALQGSGSMPMIPIPYDIVLSYIAETQIGLIAWWLETDSKYSPDMLAEVATRLIETGMFGLIEKEPVEGDVSFNPFKMA